MATSWLNGSPETVFAEPSDLPYRLVEPGKWEFSDGVDRTISGPAAVSLDDEDPVWIYYWNTSGAQYHSQDFSSEALALAALSLVFTSGDNAFTATRASLPGHLLDRAVNAISVTDTINLTLPSLITGKSRDFYLKMAVTGSQQVSFSPSTGVTYTGLGNPDKTYSAGNYLLHFTETATNVFNVTNQLAATGSYNDLTDKPSIPTVDSTLSTSGAAADAKAAGDAITPLQMAAWYPDGSVKSPAEWTPKWDGTTGLKYNEAAKDVVNKTVTVCSFFNASGGAVVENNCHLSGRVVIPPYVDIDGERYTVAGIAVEGSFSTVAENYSVESVVAPTTVTSIGSSCLRLCKALTSVVAPAVTKVYTNAFYGCTSLASISLPVAADVRLQAFANCSSLVHASLPSASSAGVSVFSGCSSLVSVSLPAAAVDQDAFRRCYSLVSAYLPNATSVGNSAFSGCTALECVDFGSAPRSSVPTLAANAFSNVPVSCLIIVPDAQYDAWIAANNWSTLYSNGYRFLKHSEWEYARKYDIPYDLVSKTPVSGAVTLSDNAVNNVSVTDAITFTLPSLVTGKSRDFYLKMTVTGSQQVSFSPSSGITYTGLGNPAKTYSAGTYVLHFRETSASEFCVTDIFTDETLTKSGVAADAQAVGEALDGKRGIDDLSYGAGDWFVTGAEEMLLVRDSSVQPPNYQWVAVHGGKTWALVRTIAYWQFGVPPGLMAIDSVSGSDATSLTFEINGSVYKLTKDPRLALTTDIPTKTSDLTNDSGFLTQSDLPYSLVAAEQTGSWQFSGEGVQSGHTYTVDEQALEGYFEYTLKDNGSTISVAETGEYQNSVDFSLSGSPSVNITATRAWALQDRAVNVVTISSGVTSAAFQFPVITSQTKARDFFVRLIIQGSTPPTISFVEADGVTPVAFDADDDSWADIEPGVNILMFTDTAR